MNSKQKIKWEEIKKNWLGLKAERLLVSVLLRWSKRGSKKILVVRVWLQPRTCGYEKILKERAVELVRWKKTRSGAVWEEIGVEAGQIQIMLSVYLSLNLLDWTENTFDRSLRWMKQLKEVFMIVINFYEERCVCVRLARNVLSL